MFVHPFIPSWPHWYPGRSQEKLLTIYKERCIATAGMLLGLILFKKNENILTWTLVTRLDSGHLLGLLLLLDHDHASTVHHSTGLGDIILTGGHHAGGDDKCKCWGHGNGENYEEYCYGSPAAGAVAEIFGECCQTGVRWVTRSRLLDCVAQGVEVALKSPRELLQLSRASEMFQLFLCCWLSPIWPMII